MRNCYYLKLGATSTAIADLVDYYSLGLMLTRINIPAKFRGKGLGSTLLKDILADADKEGVKLFLEIQSSDGLTADQLRAWYLRHDFKPWKGIYMRLPK